MPMLEKKLFKRNKPPENLNPNEELFYCKVTNEVFREYETFFERVILCNSLVWTCALTGKSNLTFQEALESEDVARESLRTFPTALRKPVLYLALLTNRGRLNDMCDDVFAYIKDRFFVGEEVEVTVNNIKKSCEVTQVILPEKVVKSPVKPDARTKKSKEISPSKIKYEVVNYSTGKTTVVKADCLSRPKGTYTKPRNKLFLKHHTQPKNGVWKVKENVVKKNQIHEFQFSEAFSGPPPSYAASPDKRKIALLTEKLAKATNRKLLETQSKKAVQGKLNFKKESVDEKKKSVEKQALTEKQRLAAEKEKQKAREKLKLQLEEAERKMKERQRLEKLKEKEKKREEKKKIAEYLNTWKKPRDDLECDDLKDLPPPTPIDCGIPQNCFGDAIMILEFLTTFGQKIEMKDAFPHGISFEQIEKALVETDIQGVFNDLLQLFLTAIFRFQEAGDDVPVPKKVDIRDDLNNMSIDEAMDHAYIVSTWPQKYHGTHLRNIPMDSFSLTEILRLHILSSGSKRRVNWQGIILPSEDPALYFKMEESDLLRRLAYTSVFELNSVDRCKILSLLINQLLSIDVLRYAVDENADNTRPLRHQLKQLRWAYTRKQKEDILNNKKKPLKENITEGNSEEPAEEVPATAEEEEKENTDNLSPEEKAELDEKKAREAARQKAEFLRKEREVESQIRKLQSSFNVAPVGKDRAFRRYWVFPSISGIFVEDDDVYKGGCLLKPTMQVQSQNAVAMKVENSPSNIKKYLQSMDTKNGSSDKENEILRDIAIVQSDLPFPLKNRKLTDLNPRVDSKKSVMDTSLREDETCLQCKLKKKDTQDNSMWYCPHSKSTVPSDQCSANIDTCLVHNMSAPRSHWAFYYKEEDLDTLISSLNPRGFRERALKEALVSEKERIRELLARCQYNIFNRSLPPPPLPEVRKSQRHQNNQNSSYAKMSPHRALEVTLRDMILELEHRIFAGGLGALKVSDRETWRATIEQGAIEAECEQMDSSEKDAANVKEEKEVKELSLEKREENVKDLACAMLQLSRGIEAKYLHPPLGETDDQKKTKQKSQEDAESQKKKATTRPALERWQESVLQCTGPSQLFVHLGTLERSVAWSRSVLKAHCRICRRRGDAENMLLCDECNRGHHLYCLKPPLEAIPEGDWFCVSCKPIEKPASPQKRRLNKTESESDMESSENDSDNSNGDEEEEESVEEDDLPQESCEACGDVGTLLCCDNCPLMYHPECVFLKRIPRGEWLCPKCSKKEEALKKANKHPASGSHGTRSSTLSSETKKKSTSLKTKIGSKGTKRKYEDSFEDEFEPPTKKSARDRKSYSDESEKEENPFKKVYKDSATNRRRSKSLGGSDMLDYKACLDLLVELMRHPSSWPFLVPVSKKDAPDYHNIIKRPMDFGTIRSKLNYMSYRCNEDFVRDLYLVLQNCEWFNPRNSPEFKAARILDKEVKRLLAEYRICQPLNGRPAIENS